MSIVGRVSNNTVTVVLHPLNITLPTDSVQTCHVVSHKWSPHCLLSEVRGLALPFVRNYQ